MSIPATQEEQQQQEPPILTLLQEETLAEYTYDGDGKLVMSQVGNVVTLYPNSYYEVQGATVRKYYFAGSQRIAVRENNELTFLLTDHLGSTVGTVNSSGNLGSQTKYTAFGETRGAATTNTDYLYTGQRAEGEIGLYFYNARWYDPHLGRFISPDTIIPNNGEGKKLNEIGYYENSNCYALTVGYHEYQLINQKHKKWDDGSLENIIVPTFFISFDRYAYTFNNPIRFVDPTGHETTPTDWLIWLEQNVRIIWRNAPPVAKNFFFKVNPDGKFSTRILMVDHPHLYADYWHLNTDLKLLKSIDHKNIGPFIEKAAGTYYTLRTFTNTTINFMLPITSGEVFVPFIFVTPKMFELKIRFIDV